MAKTKIKKLDPTGFRQDIFTFGRELLDTGDLDPVYIMLWNSDLMKNREKLSAWLLAYWCFYHVGTASWIVDQPSFWEALMTAAKSSAYPRASERRHFRAKNAIESVEYMIHTGLTPGRIIASWKADTLAEVSEAVKVYKGFGDWISFKIADMLERLDLCPVQFSVNDVFFLYDAPLKGAGEMWRRNQDESSEEEDIPEWAIRKLTEELGEYLAPPRFERPINIQEIETILCKWKSHLNGHYEVGHDIKEVRSGLLKFARCRTSQKLLKACSVGGLW